MKKLKYLVRLLVPSLVLGFFSFYAMFVDGSGNVPLLIKLLVALLTGYFFPNGGWRWAILIGVGVNLSQVVGHLIDSSPIPSEYLITPLNVVRELFPAFIGVYSGILVRRYLLGISDDSHSEGQTQLERIEKNLDNLSVAIDARKKFDEAQVSARPVLPTIPTKPIQPVTILSQPAPVKQEAPAKQVEAKRQAKAPAVSGKEEPSKRNEALKRLESKLGLK